MAEFKLEPIILENSQPINNAYLKNLKEVKIGSGSYHTFADGRTEYRDANENLVIVIDPNG